MTALIIPAVLLGSVYALWIFFLAVMCLARAKHAGLLTPLTYALGYPVLFVGYVLDCFVDWFVMTILFVELPRETTVTARLKRHNLGTGWRKSLAAWFEPVLDPFDSTGKHI